MKTHIADFLASFVSLVLRGLQNGGELVLGLFILLPVPPLIEENNKLFGGSHNMSSKICLKQSQKLSKITYLMRAGQSDDDHVL